MTQPDNNDPFAHLELNPRFVDLGDDEVGLIVDIDESRRRLIDSFFDLLEDFGPVPKDLATHSIYSKALMQAVDNNASLLDIDLYGFDTIQVHNASYVFSQKEDGQRAAHILPPQSLLRGIFLDVAIQPHLINHHGVLVPEMPVSIHFAAEALELIPNDKDTKRTRFLPAGDDGICFVPMHGVNVCLEKILGNCYDLNEND